MRLWAWEENNHKQNRKRKVLWAAAVLCWVAALYLTHFIWKTLYGEVVSTNAATIAAISVGIAIGKGIRWWGGMEDPKPTKRRKTIEGIIIAAALAWLLYAAVFRGMMVYTVQALFLCAAAFWMDWMKKKDIDRISLGACTWLLASVLLVIGTLTGTRLTGIQTTWQAKKTIGAEGFTDVEYVCWMYGRWLKQDAQDTSFYEERMRDEKFYLFSGEKDGEAWRIVMDPKGGDIILAAKEGEESELANWIG